MERAYKGHGARTHTIKMLSDQLGRLRSDGSGCQGGTKSSMGFDKRMGNRFMKWEGKGNSSEETVYSKSYVPLECWPCFSEEKQNLS